MELTASVTVDDQTETYEDFQDVTVEFDDSEYPNVCTECGESVDNENLTEEEETRCDQSECATCAASGECVDCEGTGLVGEGDAEEECGNCEGSGMCPDCEGTGYGPHDGRPAPVQSWCNSAGVSISTSNDEVTVSISVGDPRGAFTMTIRRVPTDGPVVGEYAGRLLLNVPYAGMGWAHMPLRELHPGTFVIGD